MVITAYDSKAAIVKATPLNAYDRYVKPLVLNILENAERRNTLSKVSTGIKPKAKNPASMSATYTPSVAEATTDNVTADIWVALSNPIPKTNPVTKAEPKGLKM